MKMMRKQSGFTLIELMIVVAILAILMAIALPAYQDYTIRAQVAEGMNLTAGARTAVAEFWTDRGTWPGDNTDAGIASPAGSISGEYVVSVQVDDGKITATFSDTAPQKANSKIDSDILVLSPTDSGGSIAWNCSASTGTNVDTKYLPARCR